MHAGPRIVIKRTSAPTIKPALPQTAKTQVALAITITPESTLSQIPGLTSEDIDRLIRIKDKNGKLILDIKNKPTFYWLIGMLQSMTVSEMEKHFSSRTFDESAIWDAPIFKKEQQKEFLDANIYLNRVKSKVGIEECRRCASKNVIYAEKQTRSADEGMTVFYSCLNCGKTWKS